MSYPFPFHENGNAYRRDLDAHPRVLLINVEDNLARLHVAGEEHERQIPLGRIRMDLIEGMDAGDAYRIGYAAGRRTYGE